MRSRPGGVAADVEHGCAGDCGVSWSMSVLPEATSWKRAVSATRRVSTPLTDSPCQALGRGASDTRPRWGLSPNSPHHADGMRIEPAPSEPSAAPTSPAATAAALPPLEPPGARWRVPGLRVAPNVADSGDGPV